MEIRTGLKLSQSEVLSLLNRFDDSSDTPLHEGLDFESYGKKLSNFAYFVIALEEDKMIGFLAYYLNQERCFAYVPQTVVHRDGRHKGAGHAMFEALNNVIKNDYQTIRLEVLKSNENARRFYEREGFVEIEDHKERLLLEKKI